MSSECASTFGCQAVPGDGLPRLKRLAQSDITLVFQLAKLGAEVTVGLVQQLFEAGEGNLVAARQEDANGQPRPVLQDRIQRGERLGGRMAGHG